MILIHSLKSLRSSSKYRKTAPSGRGVYSRTMRTRPSWHSDRELIRACRRGEEDAWRSLVEKYRHLVYSIPYRNGLGAEESDEVFQAVFLSLIRHIDELKQERTLVPWLMTTTQRQSWKAGRAKAQRGRLLEEVSDALPDPAWLEDDLEVVERQIAVRAALECLDPRCRGLLEILFYSDPPAAYTEISRRMKMPVASIGPTRMRCLEKLERELRKTGLF